MGRLLFLSSKRKRPNADPLPAVERYDGPTFRVLRRYLNQQRTFERAQELKPQVETQLRAALRSNRHSSALICGSRKGRGLSDEEWEALESCRCPACIEHGLEGLKAKKIFGFSNRTTHNLWVLLEEARYIDEHLQAGTYRSSTRAMWRTPPTSRLLTFYWNKTVWLIHDSSIPLRRMVSS